MDKTLLRLLVVPIFVLLAGFRLHHYLTVSSADGGENPPAESIYTGTSVMPRETYLKIHALRGRLANTAPPVLTDDEVDWLLESRKAVDPNKPYAASIARTRPLDVLLLAHLSPAQKKKVFRAVVPDFTSRDRWGATGDRIRACDAVQALHDKRGIPFLLPLLHHPDARVRARAQSALISLGYAPSRKSPQR